MLNVDKVIVSDYETNCYLVTNDKNVIIIDPGDDVNLIINYINDNQLMPVGYLITHNHPDHVGALNALINKYNISEITSNENFDFKTIPTPGHTSDGKCFYFETEKMLFTGDTLFKNTIGRMDLGGNHRDMFASLKLLKALPEDVIVYPGHGEQTTIGFEKQHNIWLK